jgi:hypothetical protein
MECRARCSARHNAKRIEFEVIRDLILKSPCTFRTILKTTKNYFHKQHEQVDFCHETACVLSQSYRLHFEGRVAFNLDLSFSTHRLTLAPSGVGERQWRGCDN